MIEGQLVTPTLRLVRVLGTGGMGSVWVADHLALRTQVAVKFMDAQFAHSADFVRRFQTEAIAAAAIKSPHVGQVFDHGITAEQEPYIVMELLQGEDLRGRLRRTGPLTPVALAPILSQIAKALGSAHELGIVHRDIKPANVFLMKYGDEVFVKVLDFGIAKLSDDGTAGGHTVTGNMMGTAPYMSPEQLVGGLPVDYRADLWALGVVAYKALTGKLPFNGPTLGAVSIAVHAGNFIPPSEARAGHAGLSSAMDAWMRRALARDPSARFASAREMADAFERASHQGGSPHLPGPGPTSKDLEDEATRAVLAPAESDPAASHLGPRSTTGATLGGTAHTAEALPGAPTHPAPPPDPQRNAPAGRRRAPFALAAVLLLAGAGVYAATAGHDGGHAQPPGPARNEAARPEPAPLARTGAPVTMGDPPKPPALPPAIDLNDLPSTTTSTTRTSGASNAGRRRAAPPTAQTGAAAPPKASAGAGTPEAPPPAATPPPAAPEEPDTVILNGGCARCTRN